MAGIKHIFVLMMENRSFDHLLGLSGLPGVAPPAASWGLRPGALDRASSDPPHEYQDVQAQIAGTPPNSGFHRQPYASVSLQGFGAGTLPVLTALARAYCLFDNWYASMPGPTWPNRFFAHAASSGGLDNSPSDAECIESETIDSLSFTFQHGTLFERLQQAGKSWRVYHADAFPQVLAIKHMIDPFRLNDGHFSWIGADQASTFARDLNNGYTVDYTFIEPDYGMLSGGLAHGNSQHPTGSVAAGEAFIGSIYRALRRSAIWNDSLLFVTYDEHGGFFDHLYPPPGTPPGDDDRNRPRAAAPVQFGFGQLGLRVPTVAISPRIPAGSLGSQRYPNQCLDHTALISTVRELLGAAGAPLAALTRRDASMPSVAGVCELSQPRALADTPSLDEFTPPPSNPAAAPEAKSAAAAAATASDFSAAPERSLRGFARIAMSLDLAIAQARNLDPIAKARPELELCMPPAGVATASANLPHRTNQLLRYIQAVAERHRSGSTDPAKP
ncbi:MAG: alkaline phosphatase family protein [Steroidobacteraceae bacterium]